MKKILFPILLCVLSLNAAAQELPRACKKIKRTVDDFTGDIRISTPTVGLNMPVITKVISGENEEIFLKLEVNKAGLAVGEKGVIILLDNGEKITKPEAEINVDVSQYGYKYSALFNLNAYELETLSNITINKYRLHIYDGEFNEKWKTRLMTQMGCIIEMK